jgi:hypothetical protein
VSCCSVIPVVPSVSRRAESPAAMLSPHNGFAGILAVD